VHRSSWALGVVVGVALTWLLPSGALAVNVAIGQQPATANTVFVMAAPGEDNSLTITRDASGFTVTENNPPAMTAGTGCSPGPGNSATCPDAGISQLYVTLGDADDGVTLATPTNAVILGGSGNDTVQGAGGQDLVRGEDGNDTIRGGPGDDALYGDDASELDPGSGADWVDGEDGNDSLNGGRGADTLLGSAGADVLKGGSDPDALWGGDGADRVAGEEGDDRMDGGSGDDVVGIAGTIAVGATLLPAEPGNDILTGGPGNDTLDPGMGGDADHDALAGGDGADAVSYGLRTAPVETAKDGAANDGQANEGDNVGSDVERITGGLANDTIGGGSDADVLDGGPGDDSVIGLAGDDDLHGDGGLSAGTDTVSGGPGNDRIEGEAGADVLSGDAGGDVVDGGTGGDTLNGGAGADQLLGGSGRDGVAYTTTADVTVRLDAGLGSSAQTGDTDRIVQVEDVDGGAQRDTVTGSSEGNALDGGRGEDYVDGRRGVDRLDGGSSADVVVARDRARDEPVACGPGEDLAIVDRTDRVARRGRNRCERVDDGSDTTPRRGWVYVHPDRCAGSGAELGLPAMHRRVPLRYSVLLPSGFGPRAAPTLDSTDCSVQLRATPGQGRTVSAELSGAAVKVDQSAGRRVTTTLTVERPTCAARGRSPAAVAREPRLRVRTDRRRGRWRVKGQFSIGAAIGTDWVTLESCSRTVTEVRRGRVRVFDRAKRRTVIVRAGQRYVAERGK
jgi:Ca2+-binding RTX toxin-like protein